MVFGSFCWKVGVAVHAFLKMIMLFCLSFLFFESSRNELWNMDVSEGQWIKVKIGNGPEFGVENRFHLGSEFTNYPKCRYKKSVEQTRGRILFSFCKQCDFSDLPLFLIPTHQDLNLSAGRTLKCHAYFRNQLSWFTHLKSHAMLRQLAYLPSFHQIILDYTRFVLPMVSLGIPIGNHCNNHLGNPPDLQHPRPEVSGPQQCATNRWPAPTWAPSWLHRWGRSVDPRNAMETHGIQKSAETMNQKKIRGPESFRKPYQPH